MYMHIIIEFNCIIYRYYKYLYKLNSDFETFLCPKILKKYHLVIPLVHKFCNFKLSLEKKKSS